MISTYCLPPWLDILVKVEQIRWIVAGLERHQPGIHSFRVGLVDLLSALVAEEIRVSAISCLLSSLA